MARIDFRWVAFLWTLTVPMFTPAAMAQYYGSGPPCACATPVATSAAAPVFQTCFQTVPVTEYEREERTVRRPVFETTYEDRPVTVYRPKTEERIVEVPTVRYQNVTEYQTVHRDFGRWQTNYKPVPRVSPCQYDGRPGLSGWLNRTGYSMGSSFAPRYVASRQYIPNVVARQIPVTRQLAVRGTREVRQHVTRMVAHRESRKVAVRKVRYVDKKVTVMKPVTAYRTVPIGTNVAYGGYGRTSVAFSPWGGRAVAYGLPVIEESESTRTTRRPEPDDNFSRGSTSGGTRRRSASRSSGREPRRTERDRESDSGFRRSTRGTTVDPTSLRLEENLEFGEESSTALGNRHPSVVRRTAFPGTARTPRGWRRTRRSALTGRQRAAGPHITLVSDVRP